MSRIKKLVIFANQAQLDQHAAGYPCLVNFNPFTKTGECDDGAGHTATMQFLVADAQTVVTLPASAKDAYDNIEFASVPLTAAPAPAPPAKS